MSRSTSSPLVLAVLELLYDSSSSEDSFLAPPLPLAFLAHTGGNRCRCVVLQGAATHSTPDPGDRVLARAILEHVYGNKIEAYCLPRRAPGLLQQQTGWRSCWPADHYSAAAHTARTAALEGHHGGSRSRRHIKAPHDAFLEYSYNWPLLFRLGSNSCSSTTTPPTITDQTQQLSTTGLFVALSLHFLLSWQSVWCRKERPRARPMCEIVVNGLTVISTGGSGKRQLDAPYQSRKITATPDS
jgi:hypothetical protein